MEIKHRQCDQCGGVYDPKDVGTVKVWPSYLSLYPYVRLSKTEPATKNSPAKEIIEDRELSGDYCSRECFVAKLYSK